MAATPDPQPAGGQALPTQEHCGRDTGRAQEGPLPGRQTKTDGLGGNIVQETPTTGVLGAGRGGQGGLSQHSGTDARRLHRGQACGRTGTPGCAGQGHPTGRREESIRRSGQKVKPVRPVVHAHQTSRSSREKTFHKGEARRSIQEARPPSAPNSQPERDAKQGAPSCNQTRGRHTVRGLPEGQPSGLGGQSRLSRAGMAFRGPREGVPALPPQPTQQTRGPE